jgi:hypothetical protein
MLFVTLFLLQGVAPLADPVAPASQGRVQCHAPDRARKTCRSIGSYVRTADGTVNNTAVVLIQARPAVVMTSTAPVTIKDGAICGRLSSADAQTFAVDGRAASPDVAAALREAVAKAYSPLADREICTSYVPDGEGLKSRVYVDGARRPDFDMQVLWVDPAEGFSVSP